MRNSAVSIPSNLAEGCGRTTDKEYARFFEYSLGSSCELETQLIIASQRKYYENEQIIPHLISIQKRISSLMKILKKRKMIKDKMTCLKYKTKISIYFLLTFSNKFTSNML